MMVGARLALMRIHQSKLNGLRRPPDKRPRTRQRGRLAKNEEAPFLTMLDSGPRGTTAPHIPM